MRAINRWGLSESMDEWMNVEVKRVKTKKSNEENKTSLLFSLRLLFSYEADFRSWAPSDFLNEIGSPARSTMVSQSTLVARTGRAPTEVMDRRRVLRTVPVLTLEQSQSYRSVRETLETLGE